MALATGALLASGTATATAKPVHDTQPCALAEALRKAGLFAEAAQHYHAVAKATSPAKLNHCVTDGLKQIRSARHARADQISAAAPTYGLSESSTPIKRLVAAAGIGAFGEMPHVVAREISQRAASHGFTLARVLVAAHYPGVADKVASATVNAHPEARVPPGLRRLEAAAQYRTASLDIAAATALADAGFDDEADTKVKAAIEADPTIDVPEELKAPTRREPGWRSWLGEWGPRIVSAAEIVAVALAILVALLLLPLLLARAGRRFQARMLIEDFTAGSDAQKDYCRATTVAVRENYGRLNEADGGSRPRYVDSSAETFPAMPPKVVEAFPQVGWIAGLLTMLDALVPTRTRRVTAELRPRDPARGAGLTITFGRLHGKVFDEITLWESDYGTPLTAGSSNDQLAYDRVALPAAAWLTYAAANHTLRRSLWWPWRRPPFSVLGTQDWRSYALFAVGADQEAANLPAVAKLRYDAALGRDPANFGALFNLVGLRLHEQGLTSADLAVMRAQLQDVCAHIRSTNGLWYRARYLEVVTLLHSAGPPNAPAARAVAVDLCATLLDELDRLEHWWQRVVPILKATFTRGVRSEPYRANQARNRRELLRDLRPAALLLLASTLLVAGGPTGPVATLTDTTLRQRLLAVNPLSSASAVAALDAAIRHPQLVAYVIEGAGA